MSLVLNQVMMLKNEKKDVFYNLRKLTNLLWQWHAMWRKLNLCCICFNSSEGQESCDSLAKNNFGRATFWKFGTVCDRVTKNSEASRNFCNIYLKSKHSHEHCIWKLIKWLKRKGMILVCLSLHFIAALDNVLYNCLHLLLPCWS